MKKSLSQIFDSLEPQELDVLLDGIHADPLDRSAAERLSAKVLAGMDRPEKTRVTRRPWRTVAVLAACLALLVSAGFGTFAYAAEVREYNEAVRFFAEYELPTEGLTRGEIKAVYRDITTNAFTYDKTAEVIQKSLSAATVGGYEIVQQDPTPEDVESLWNYKNYNGRYWVADRNQAQTVRYSFRSEYKTDSALGFDVHDKSYLEKYEGDALLWRVAVTAFCISGYSTVSDGVIAYGDTPTWSGDQTSYAWMAKIDNDGSLAWEIKLDNGFQHEYIEAVLENDDGSYAVISCGDQRYFCLSRYSADGSATYFYKTEVGKRGVSNAARFGDGYIVQLVSHDYTVTEPDYVVKVDADGRITGAFSYSSGEAEYHITNMIEYDGNIYLSAYAVPKSAQGQGELAAVYDYLAEKDTPDIPSEELTPLVRANYTAVLLVCDPNAGTPQEFYSVKGSLGGALALSDSGRLLWDVESITTTSFSPYTSSFTISGTCYVFRYTFDENGALLSQEKTGEVADYRR